MGFGVQGPRWGALPEVVIACAVIIACTLVGSCLSGCGASAATQSAYALEQARCIANEREIVDRPDTTEEQDRQDMTAERARCDAALDAIETNGGDDGR